ncbi:uncharacterized protein FFFS_14194 [Fusarium fujikuroi]|nr:uncharacterized protein FFFS_14194 [Fusarium fujikuroi]
MPQLYI